MAAAQRGGPSAIRRRWEASQRCPRPPPYFNCGERWWKTACDGGGKGSAGFKLCGQKSAPLGHYLYESFDRIVDDKNPNTFLV
jgi:hypothetical protein